MALSGAVTQLALYGGIGLPYPPLTVEPEPPTPAAVTGGAHGGRWVHPNRRTLEREGVPEREPSRERAKPEVQAAAPAPTPPPPTSTGELEVLATDPAEEELLLQAALVLLGLVD